MRIFLCASAVSAITYVLGSAAPTPITVVVTQGGALAILGWAFWHLLTRHIPAERKEFREAHREERHDYMKSNERMAEAIDKLSDAIKDM